MSFLRSLRVLLSFPRSFHGTQCCRMKLIDKWDLVTGKERWEALQHAKGNTAPFLEKPVLQGPGTKDCPIVVPSVFDKRIVLCLCENGGLVRFYLHDGFPRRCFCNKWFIMERIPVPKIYEDDPDCYLE